MKEVKVNAQDVLYVLKVDISKIDESLDRGSCTYLAVLNENPEIVQAAILEGGEYMGGNDGAAIGCPANIVKEQVEMGIAEVIETQDYFTSIE